MVGPVALQHDFSGQLGPPRAARHLGEELERALGGAEVGQAQAHVGVDHAHEGHAREVVALGDHLCAHQDVGLPGFERQKSLGEGAPALGQVTIQAGHPGLGQGRLHRFDHLLRAEALELEVGASARRAGAGSRDAVAAIVAQRLPPPVVEGEAHRAVGAHRLLPALAAQEARGPAPAVQEENGLLLLLEAFREGFLEGRAQDGIASGPEDRPAVHDLHLRKASGGDALRETEQRVLALRGVVERLEGRCRRAEDDGRPLEAGAHHRHVAAVVAGAVFLLVAAFVLFVDHHEAEGGQGCEDRRARSHHHARVPLADAPPLIVALPRRQIAVLHRHRRTEARDGRPHEQVGEGDLGHQDQDGPSRFESPLGGSEVDLGLAAARDPVQKEGPEALLAHCGLEARESLGLIVGGLGPAAVAARQRFGRAHVALF